MLLHENVFADAGINNEKLKLTIISESCFAFLADGLSFKCSRVDRNGIHRCSFFGS